MPAAASTAVTGPGHICTSAPASPLDAARSASTEVTQSSRRLCVISMRVSERQIESSENWPRTAA